MNKIMQKLTILGSVLLLALSMSIANAVSFCNEYDFDSDGITYCATFQALRSGSSYTHDLSDIFNSCSGNVEFTQATLSLTYMYMTGYVTTGSVWYVEGNNIWVLGKLNQNGIMNEWITDSFAIPNDTLASMSSNGKLVVKLLETPDGVSDRIFMDKSVLCGEYECEQNCPNVPEFSSLALAVMGLVPIGLITRKRR